MVHKSMALTLYDVFALNLDDPDDARCRLAEAVCDRYYFVYVDEAGNEVRLSPDADAPDGTEPIPIWTRDMDLSIVEWTNTDPAIGNVGGAWIRKGEGWAHAGAYSGRLKYAHRRRLNRRKFAVTFVGCLGRATSAGCRLGDRRAGC
jgi:hypothetical protein